MSDEQAGRLVLVEHLAMDNVRLRWLCRDGRVMEEIGQDRAAVNIGALVL